MDHGRPNDDRLPVAFGSASMLDHDDDAEAARGLLLAALAAGAGRLDTAPMYGHGSAERIVLELGAERGVPVTTKVGMEPRPRPSLARRTAAAAVDRLPSSVRTAVRRASGRGSDDPYAPSGRFDLPVVRASVERSLRSAGRIDRLLLHEVQPPDVTDELLDLLSGWTARGDVAQLGSATRNAITASVLQRADGLLTVANVSTEPFGDPLPDVPADVAMVGHGALGVGGRDLRRLKDLLHHGDLADAWAAVTSGTPFDGERGLVLALLARARGLGVAELLVSTTRIDRAGDLVAAAGRPHPLAPAAADLLERAVLCGRADPRGGSTRAA